MNVYSTQPTLSSYLTRYNCTRMELDHAMRSYWHIRDPYKSMLQVWALSVFNGAALKQANENGRIHYLDDKYYNLVFTNCTPEQCYQAPEVFLSFRDAPDEFHLHPVCLVWIPTQEDCEEHP